MYLSFRLAPWQRIGGRTKRGAIHVMPDLAKFSVLARAHFRSNIANPLNTFLHSPSAEDQHPNPFARTPASYRRYEHLSIANLLLARKLEPHNPLSPMFTC